MRGKAPVLRGEWYRIGVAAPNPLDEPKEVIVTVKNVKVRTGDQAYSTVDTSGVRKWFDSATGDDAFPETPRETSLTEFPGVTFRCDSEKVEAVTEKGTDLLFSGMPVWSVYFCDLTRDGNPELCATVSIGSGIVDERIIVYDYATGESWELSDRGQYDYRLAAHFGSLYCEQWDYETGELFRIGLLMLTDAAGGPGRRLEIVQNGVKRVPFDTELTGAYDGYLFVPLEGKIYRYECLPVGQVEKFAKGEVLYRFTEKAEPEDVEWTVYSVPSSPDRSVLFVSAGADDRMLYRIAPPKGVGEEALAEAKERDDVILEDGIVTLGDKKWEEFCKKVERNEHAYLRTARWYTLDPECCDPTYYETNKADYPALYEYDLTYNGAWFTLAWTETSGKIQRQYQYLRSFETVVPSLFDHEEPKTVLRWVLTDDAEASYDELLRGLLSSSIAEHIDFHEVYAELKP